MLKLLVISISLATSQGAWAQQPAQLDSKALGREKVIQSENAKVKVSGEISQEETQGVVNTNECDSKKHLWKKKKDAGSGDLFHACYLDEKIDGRIIYYFADGKVKKEGYRRGEKNQGRWTRYYEDGKIQDRGEWKDDVPDDDWKLYYPNGNLKSQGEFDKGKRVGEWIDYYENAEKKSVENFNKEGKAHGAFREYFVNGQPKTQGRYKDGQKVEEWKNWNEKGELLSAGYYACDKKQGEWQERESEQLVGKTYAVDPCGTGHSADDRHRGRFFHFRASGLAVIQGSQGGRNYSGQANWVPTFFAVGRLFELRANTGLTFLRDGLSDSLFVRAEAGLFLAWKLSHEKKLDLETGIGVQRYFNRETTPYLGGNFVKKLPNRVLLLFSHFVVGYSAVFIQDNTTHDLRLGLGVEF